MAESPHEPGRTRQREIFLRRAEAAGYGAIVLTLDTSAMAWRPRDLDLGHLPFLRGKGIAQYVSDPVFRRQLEDVSLDDSDDGPPLTVDAVLSLLALCRRFPGSFWENLRTVHVWARPGRGAGRAGGMFSTGGPERHIIEEPDDEPDSGDARMVRAALDTPPCTESSMMRSRLSSLAFVTVLSLAPGASAPAPASAQQSFEDVEIRVHPVRGGVYYLEGRGGNIGLSVGEDGVVMVDDQFAQLTDQIVDAIREIDDGPIRFVINTHVHGDHVGGNANFARMGVDILARDAVRRRLAAGDNAEAALPVLTFEEDIDLHLNDEEIVVFGVPPAHTDGDSYIHFRNADVLHAGDVFRTTGYPYIDRANGGTLEGTLDALGIIIGLSGPETLIIPGHGEVSSREDVEAFRDMVLDVRARVGELVARGMSYEQVASASPTAPYDDQWGDPERFLRAVYEELSEE